MTTIEIMDSRTETAISIDDPASYARFDPSGLHDRIAGLPDQCDQAWREAKALELPGFYADSRSVAILGVGGSAIGGDILAGLISQEKTTPLSVIRDYSLPGWIGADTLAIVSSYSGNTEETLFMYRQAKDAGARVVVITSGGELGREAGKDGVPILDVPFVGEPRAALGYTFAAPMAILCRLGLLQDRSVDMEEAGLVLRELRTSLTSNLPTSQNPAKQLAVDLFNRLVVVYGAGLLFGVARRWKVLLNENSKAWAFAEEIPEVNHNSIQSFVNTGLGPSGIAVVLLQSNLLHPRTSPRYRLTRELLDRHSLANYQVEAIGKSPLAQVLSTTFIGDFVSYYLAVLYGIDPSATPLLDQMKQRLNVMEGP